MARSSDWKDIAVQLISTEGIAAECGQRHEAGVGDRPASNIEEDYGPTTLAHVKVRRHDACTLSPLVVFS